MGENMFRIRRRRSQRSRFLVSGVVSHRIRCPDATLGRNVASRVGAGRKGMPPTTIFVGAVANVSCDLVVPHSLGSYRDKRCWPGREARWGAVEMDGGTSRKCISNFSREFFSSFLFLFCDFSSETYYFTSGIYVYLYKTCMLLNISLFHK